MEATTPQPPAGSPQPGREISAGGVVRETFSVYGENFAALIGGALIVFVIVGLVAGLLDNTGSIILNLLATIVRLVGYAVFVGFVVHLVQDVRDGRRDHSMGDLFSAATPAIGSLIIFGILFGIAVGIGFFLLIIPGLFLITMWSVGAPAIVVEGIGSIDAFGRSWSLVKGHGWSVFGALILILLIVIVVQFVLVLIGAAIGLGGVIVASIIASALTAPIYSIAVSVLYFDLAGSAAPAVAEPIAPAAQRLRERRRARRRRQGGARRSAAIGARRVGARAGARDPLTILERQAASRVQELVPIRYGRMVASPFAFYRGAAAVMAADLAATPAERHPGAALRRRAPLQLRRLRRARPPPRLRPQRLRRDPARPVGVGREAARGELRDRRPRSTASSAKQREHGRSRPRPGTTARRCASSPRCATSTSGTRASTSRHVAQRCATRRRPQSRPSAERTVAKARAQGQPAGARKLTHAVDGELRIVSRPAADRPARGAAPTARAEQAEERCCASRSSDYSATLRDDRRRLLDALPLRAHRPQGGRGRQRRHPRLDRPAHRPRRPGPALPAGEGGAGLGARALRRRRASSATTASGWSRGSG